MSLNPNGFGRHYATCDTPYCESNVIDLPPDLEACARILRTFFRWTQLATVVPGETALHECPLCRSPEIKKYRPGGLPRGFPPRLHEGDHDVRNKTVYNLLFAAVIVLLIGSALLARAEDPRSISVTREVPANASLNYLVDGRVVQSMPLRPGAYRITVERLGK